ncbi:28232_t:CDS:2, partial [Dentiscutata erythropus]
YHFEEFHGIYILIKLEEIVIAVDMEVIDATGYVLILETDWLRKAYTIIDYQEYKLILKDDK